MASFQLMLGVSLAPSGGNYTDHYPQTVWTFTTDQAPALIAEIDSTNTTVTLPIETNKCIRHVVAVVELKTGGTAGRVEVNWIDGSGGSGDLVDILEPTATQPAGFAIWGLADQAEATGNQIQQFLFSRTDGGPYIVKLYLGMETDT